MEEPRIPLSSWSGLAFSWMGKNWTEEKIGVGAETLPNHCSAEWLRNVSCRPHSHSSDPSPHQDEVARRAAEALTSLSGTQYRVGSIFTTVCKYTLYLFII